MAFRTTAAQFINPASSDKKLKEARGNLTNYDFSQALPAYEKLTQQFPRRAQIWFEYGCAAGGASQMDLADRAWRKAVELEPRNGQLMLQIGHHYQGLRQPEKARAWFEKAAAIDPRDINPHMAVAILLEQTHRFAEAREAIASCLAIDPRDDQARYYAAFIDRRENKMEDAERRLRDLIASSPRHQYVQYASRYELAEVLSRTDRFDEAMQMLLEAKNLVRRLGNIEAMLQEYDLESGQYRRSSQELPKDILRIWAREFPERAREAIPGWLSSEAIRAAARRFWSRFLAPIQAWRRWMSRAPLRRLPASYSMPRRKFPPPV